MAKLNAKSILTILLLLSCLVTATILATVPSHTPSKIGLNNGLDSLINNHFEDHFIPKEDIRRFSIEVDTAFTRSVYRVNVPPSFSKTMFHFDLHRTLLNYDITTPARVLFPEQDMNIYIVDKGTVRSTIRLLTTKQIPEGE